MVTIFKFASEEIAAAGLTTIFCPCCNQVFREGSRADSHKFDCKLVQYNAKISRLTNIRDKYR